MSHGVFLRVCSKEYRICSGEEAQSKSACSKCFHKNQDIILITYAIVVATLAALTAYGYIPCGSTDPMFTAGCLTMLASVAFMWGSLQALAIRGCIVIRRNPVTQEV